MALTFKIDGKEQEFKFGMRFMRELDKTNVVDQNGVKFGVGTEMALTRLTKMGDYTALSDILTAANRAAGGKLTTNAIDDFLDETDNVDEIMNDVVKQLQESKFTSEKMKSLEK